MKDKYSLEKNIESMDFDNLPKTSWKEYLAKGLLPLGLYVPFKEDKARGLDWTSNLIEKSYTELVKCSLWGAGIYVLMEYLSK